MLATAVFCDAQTTTVWDAAGSGDWSQASTWSGGEPDANRVAVVRPPAFTDEVTVSAANESANRVVIEQGTVRVTASGRLASTNDIAVSTDDPLVGSRLVVAGRVDADRVAIGGVGDDDIDDNVVVVEPATSAGSGVLQTINNVIVGFNSSTGASGQAVIGGQLRVGDQLFLGLASDTSGDVRVSGGRVTTGTGSVTRGNLEVGVSGDGVYVQENGGATTVFGRTVVAANSGSTGELTVTDGLFDARDFSLIGENGRGVANVSGSGVIDFAESVHIGRGATGSGELNITGGGTVRVGEALRNFDVRLGSFDDSDGELVVRDAGSTLDVIGDLTVGSNGAGRATLSAGARVTADAGTGLGLILAEFSGSSGVMTIEDAGTQASVTGLIAVGNQGNGTLTLRNGASLTSTNSGMNLGAVNETSRGLVTVADNSSLTLAGGDLLVGREGDGTFSLAGTATVDVADDLIVGVEADSDGVFTQTGGAIRVGLDGGPATRNFIVGLRGDGRYTQTGGSLEVEDDLLISDGLGADGVVQFSGGTASVGNLVIKANNPDLDEPGSFQRGSLTIAAGELRVRGSLLANNDAEITVAGGALVVGETAAPGELVVGSNGGGTYLQTSGSVVVHGDFVTGDSLPRSGAATLSNGSIDVNGNLHIGRGSQPVTGPINDPINSAFAMTGGDVTVSGDLLLGSPSTGISGSVEITGGTLSVDGDLVSERFGGVRLFGSSAVLEIAGDATLFSNISFRGITSFGGGATIRVGGELLIDATQEGEFNSGRIEADVFRTFQSVFSGADVVVRSLSNGGNLRGGSLTVERFANALQQSGGLLTNGDGIGQITADRTPFFAGGRYDMTGGTLELDIAGAEEHDSIYVVGDAFIEGVLDIDVWAGAALQVGDAMPIVTAAEILSADATLAAPDLGPLSFALKVVELDSVQLPFDPSDPETPFFELEQEAIFLVVVPTITGDFNGDGVVDAADYTVWRDTRLDEGVGLAADADLSGVVDDADYD
ncbi:MAG: hypothetical protein AAF805_03420, partial [Planctomycetota bacterium]